jgi:glycosyltransferase involved in cell wall biosynthesis
MSPVKIGICYPTDPAGGVPSGIDSFIRGILRWAPPDLAYTLFGASTDEAARPLGRQAEVLLGDRPVRFIPIVRADAGGRRRAVPLTVRYMWALRRQAAAGKLREFDVLDFHRIEPLLLFAGDQRPKNVVLHQDMGVLRNEQSDILWRHAPWLYERIEHRLLQNVSRVFAVRESAVQRYRQEFPQSAHRFQFIPTWFDTEIFRPASAAASAASRAALRQELGCRVDTRVLTFVGRLDRQKDPLLLLQAVRLCIEKDPDLTLAIVGDGVLREQVDAAARAGPLSGRVRLLGPRRPEQIASLLQASDLFVLASAYEGMPIAVLEALATGIPVVSTDVGEVRRVVLEGQTGAISKERSAPGLAAAIQKALSMLESMRGPPCERAVEPFRPQRVLAAIFDNHRRQTQRLAA